MVFLPASLVCFGLVAADPLRVAVLSHHRPTAWSNASCTSGSRGGIACNLRLYEDAIQTAAQQNVSLLVMPEGYGLSATSAKDNFYEPFISVVGESPSATVASTSSCTRTAAAAAVVVAATVTAPAATSESGCWH